MKQTTPTITSIILFAIVASLVSCCTASYFPPQWCPLQTMPPRATTRSTQEAARRRQDEEAMAAAILQKEKNAAKAANGDDTNLTQAPLPSVVSPPSAPNLTSLLTGHVGQEAVNLASSDMDINTQDAEQVEDSAKSPKKKKSKKVKSTKEDTSTKRDRSGSSLKRRAPLQRSRWQQPPL